MFKTVLTIFRGHVAAAGEELEDRSALLILDQQMRDAAAAVDRSKRTLALAIASDQAEGRRPEDVDPARQRSWTLADHRGSLADQRSGDGHVWFADDGESNVLRSHQLRRLWQSSIGRTDYRWQRRRGAAPQ